MSQSSLQVKCNHRRQDGTSATRSHTMYGGDVWNFCTRCGAHGTGPDLPIKSGGQTAYFNYNGAIEVTEVITQPENLNPERKLKIVS